MGLIKSRPVMLRVWDVSKFGALANAFSNGSGPAVRCIWFSSISVGEKEFMFDSSGINTIDGQKLYGTPKDAILLGHTRKTWPQIRRWLRNRQKAEFHESAYRRISNNSNHFASAFAIYLTGKDIPDNIRNQDGELLKTFLTMAAQISRSPAISRAVTSATALFSHD